MFLIEAAVVEQQAVRLPGSKSKTEDTEIDSAPHESPLKTFENGNVTLGLRGALKEKEAELMVDPFK